ncbi:hypothetical protein C0Q70_10404 [Pomacea canaliculata]|uniref:Cation-dependent mannose-6-phosphate receptor n=1 Tax=Pomacea canaliculata TaxID=400727 RepID=A0A2T7PCI6_POMCA|nr:autophagy-related protein 27-like [Pomacea canaliculata]XP_025096551.1 autophagy-related protein 27-like [Pomacea canaliculata]PVD31126.1 hypothetical protein C0Q70_10404 [Pomacea canaliculata]
MRSSSPLWVLSLLWCFCPPSPGVVAAVDKQRAGAVQNLRAGTCRWTAQDGAVIDLTSVAKTDNTPRFKDVQGEDVWYYSYNPCFAFSEEICTGASVCQSGYGAYYQAGDTSSEALITDQGRPTLYYTADSPSLNRQSWVALICDKSATTPKLRAIGDVSNGEYRFELTTVCACDGACAMAVEAGLSVGTILIIVFIVVVFVYLVGGIIINKARQANGVELIPNIGFWRNFPVLVKDGFGFVGGRVSRSRSGYEAKL